MNAQSKIEAPGLAKLREPFAPNHISKLPKPTKAQTEAVRQDFKKGIRCQQCGSWHHPDVVHLDYVGHAALTDRLLDTDPEWSWEPVAFTELGLPAFDQSGGLWIKLTVLGVTRLGYGHAASKPNADPGSREKEVIGDALRNAAMRFGAALDLWHKGDLHADEDTGTNEPKQQGQQGKDNGAINTAQLSKLKIMLDALKLTEIDWLKQFGAPQGAQLHQLPESKFRAAVDDLENRMADAAKQQTNSRGGGDPADIDADEIPY